MKFIKIGILISFLITNGCNQSPETQKKAISNKKLKIAVIPKGTAHLFWKTVEAGALKAGKELDVEVVWQGPENEDDGETQVNLVQNFTSQGIDGIVLAPFNFSTMSEPVQNAVKNNIPVVIIDSQLDSKEYSSFVATDNFEGGVLCAKKLVTMMGGKGKVIMLRYMEGAASTTQREAGFFSELKKYAPDIQLISSIQYSGVTVESALHTSKNLLNRYHDVEGIFCSNESATQGMLQALQSAKKAGVVKFVGFDSSPALIEAVRKGEINGLAIQDPYMIGYLGVKTIVSVIREEKYKKRIDTGVKFVTSENIDDPVIQKLINPQSINDSIK